MEGAPCEAWPALASSTRNEENINEEGQREEIVSYGDSKGCANEAEVEVLKIQISCVRLHKEHRQQSVMNRQTALSMRHE